MIFIILFNDFNAENCIYYIYYTYLLLLFILLLYLLYIFTYLFLHDIISYIIYIYYFPPRHQPRHQSLVLTGYVTGYVIAGAWLAGRNLLYPLAQESHFLNIKTYNKIKRNISWCFFKKNQTKKSLESIISKLTRCPNPKSRTRRNLQ